MSQPTSALDLQFPAGGPPTLAAESTRGMAWDDFRAALRGLVAEHGSLLVRGIGLSGPEDVTDVFRGLSDGLMTEREAFAAREVYADGVYSSSAWPAAQPMCMHHELSYAMQVPGMMMFACLTAPASGGSTGVADSPTVMQALPSDLVQRFEHEGWLLVRSYNDEIGASWAESFGTDDRQAVEAYCRANKIDYEWQPDGGLNTRQRRRAVVAHPRTGQRCWFNQIAFLNEWTMDPDVRDYLVDIYGADGLPFTTRFGGGDPVPADVVETITGTFDQHTRREPWSPGDLLLVDNIRTAHSREPYEGARQVLVGMADPTPVGH